MEDIKKLVTLLNNKKLKLATAESCTGGLLAKTLTDISGVSSVFEMGIVTYSNRIKNEFLNVSENTLSGFGAVSDKTAEEMAKNITELANADIGVGITGIAGPTGATSTKPVGLVYFSLYFKSKNIFKTFKLNLDGNRCEVREKTVNTVIKALTEILSNEL
ncbi:MAG: competence/damage-inducible protein CinA [Clostridia bacterium]|nr:competence/damage-inducible protein CinA [Clostridia bacterium]